MDVAEDRARVPAQLAGIELQQRARHVAQHGRIDAVGLGTFARRLGKITGLAWIDDRHRQACRAQLTDDRRFQPAGGL